MAERFNNEKLRGLKKIDAIFKSIYLFPKNSKKYPVIDKNIQEIIIIGMFMLGDTVMSIPALRTLKKSFPKARLTIVGGNAVKIILSDENLVDSFILVDCPWLTNNYSLKNVVLFFSSLWKVNRIKYDIAIDFRGDWRNIFYMNFIKSARKISFNYTGGEYMLTDVISPDNSIKHYIDEWLFLLKSIGCGHQPTDKYPVLNLTKQEVLFLTDFKTKHGLGGEFVIGIHPGASSAARRWSEEKYADLIKRLDFTGKYSFIIFQGPGEGETVKKIQLLLESINNKPIIVNQNLKNYITLINSCSLLLSNDSGAGHIAAAFSIPSVIIFGKSDPETVKPYNRSHIQTISHLSKISENQPGELENADYLTSITVDEVYTITSQLIHTLKQSNNGPKNDEIIF